METEKFRHGRDYYLNENGDMVLTAEFLKKRGYCCQSGCLHCPYGYRKKIDPSIPPEFQADELWESVETNPYYNYDGDE